MSPSPDSPPQTLPSSPPFLQPPEEADLPGFATPPADQGNPPADPWDQDSATASATEPERTDRATTKARRSPVSTSPTAFVGIFTSVIQMLTFFLHLRLAPKHIPNSLWIADAQDLASIAAPLSRIAARHSPIDGAAGGDVSDAIEASIAVGGYGLKNVLASRDLDQPATWTQQDEADQAATSAAGPAFSPFGA